MLSIEALKEQKFKYLISSFLATPRSSRIVTYYVIGSWIFFYKNYPLL